MPMALQRRAGGAAREHAPNPHRSEHALVVLQERSLLDLRGMCLEEIEPRRQLYNRMHARSHLAIGGELSKACEIVVPAEEHCGIEAQVRADGLTAHTLFA